MARQDHPCVLDGNRFQVKECKRCGLRRNASAQMPRYAWCGATSDSMELEPKSSLKPLAFPSRSAMDKGEAGGASNATPASDHTLRKGRERMAEKPSIRFDSGRHGAP